MPQGYNNAIQRDFFPFLPHVTSSILGQEYPNPPPCDLAAYAMSLVAFTQALRHRNACISQICGHGGSGTVQDCGLDPSWQPVPSQTGAWELLLEKVNGKMIPESKECILDVWLCSADVKRQREVFVQACSKYIWWSLHTDLPSACSGHSNSTTISNGCFCNGC